jgi:arylsulfatase A-like enzyme
VRRFRSALTAGLLAGVIDALLVHRPVGLRFATALFFLPLVWIVWCLLVRALFLLRPLVRWAEAAVIAAGPGLLLISRVYPVLRNSAVPSVVSGGICAAAVAVLVAMGRFVPERAMAGGAMLAVAWLAGTAFFAMLGGYERAAPAAGPAPAGAPNVLLIFLDTVRYDDAQLMPNLKKLASSGVVYDRAWASAPWTLPSHLGVLTGMPPWKVPYDAASHRFLYDGPTLAERFAARGYATAAIFANPYLGPDPFFHRGFQNFHVSTPCAPCLSGLATLLSRALEHAGRDPTFFAPPDWMNASDVTAKALRTIERANGPYFLALNYMDAHSPYYVERACRGPGFVQATGADWKAWGRTYNSRAPLAPGPAARLRAQYRAAMHCMDRSIGRLLDEVQRTRDGRQTIIAVVGDHGEEFGSHGMVGHGQSLYRQVLHVPLIVKAPDQAPQRVAGEVSTLDLYDQLLRYLPESRQPLHPRPRPAIASFKTIDSPWPPKFSAAFSAVRGRYHLIRWSDGSEELYDLDSDVEETRPLPIRADDPPFAELAAALRRNTEEENAAVVSLHGVGYLQ